MKAVLLAIVFCSPVFFAKAGGLKNSAKDSLFLPGKLTPFNPQGSYQTLAMRLRFIPWTLGDDKGYNALAGVQFSFFKSHSLSADLVKAHSNSNIDAFYRNDSLIRPVRNRNTTRTEYHFAYNYHFNFERLRDVHGLSFYAGINYRIGNSHLSSDTGMYVNDHTLSVSTRYFSFGPQAGVLWNIGKTRFLVSNFNLTPFYTRINKSETELRGSEMSTQHSTRTTAGFRLGLNLILWLKYGNFK